MGREPHTRLAGECLQPLGHLSWSWRQASIGAAPGGVAERSNAPVLKTGVRQPRTAGSNPAPSARDRRAEPIRTLTRVAARGARLPARARGQQRQRVVPGEPEPLRRVSARPGPGAGRAAGRSRGTAVLPALQQPPVQARAAAQGAPRRRARAAGRWRLLHRAVARRAARRRRSASPRLRSARAVPGGGRGRPPRTRVRAGRVDRAGGRPFAGRARAEARAAGLPATTIRGSSGYGSSGSPSSPGTGSNRGCTPDAATSGSNPSSRRRRRSYGGSPTRSAHPLARPISASYMLPAAAVIASRIRG